MSATKYWTISNLWWIMATAKGDRPLDVKIGPSVFLFRFFGARSGQKRSEASHFTSFKFPPRTARWIGCLDKRTKNIEDSSKK